MQSSTTYDTESTAKEKVHWEWSELQMHVKNTKKVKKQTDHQDGKVLAAEPVTRGIPHGRRKLTLKICFLIYTHTHLHKSETKPTK